MAEAVAVLDGIKDRKNRLKDERQDKLTLNRDLTCMMFQSMFTLFRDHLFELLTTGNTMDNISFRTAHGVFRKINTVIVWGLLKRAFMLVAFLVLYFQFYNWQRSQLYLSLTANEAARCQSSPIQVSGTSYYICTYTASYSVLSSIGLAAATAGFIVPTAFWTFMYLVMGWVNYQNTMHAIDRELALQSKLYHNNFRHKADTADQLLAGEHARIEMFHASPVARMLAQEEGADAETALRVGGMHKT
jgi:hypothetical protein